MDEILDRYGELLREVDAWFARCIELHSSDIVCHKGCSACCRGLFDITVLDALYLKRGIALLDPVIRDALTETALVRLMDRNQKIPDFTAPWLLNQLSDEMLSVLMPEDDPTPCLLLSAEGECLVYKYRPMTCRLHGIPLFDVEGEAFSDEWCTLNFVDNDPEYFVDIRHRFRDLFYQEQLLFRELTLRLYGESLNELDTIIPGAVVFDGVAAVTRWLSRYGLSR